MYECHKYNIHKHALFRDRSLNLIKYVYKTYKQCISERSRMNWLLQRRRDLRNLPGGVQDRRRQMIEQEIRRREEKKLLDLLYR